MDMINELMDNEVLAVAMIAWLLAQIFKIIITLALEREFKLERFYGSGGMPSSHSSFVVGASTAIGLSGGFNTPLYAISFVLACIVMYDASGVRRSVGKQAKLLNGIIKELFNDIERRSIQEETLKELVGHKPTEVLAGAILGIIIANIML